MKKTFSILLALVFLSTAPAWAYRPLEGLSQNPVDAPVVTRSVSSSLADKDGLLESNWDTTIVLEQQDVRAVMWVEVAFSLLGSQHSSVRVRKVVLNRDHPWRKGEQWEYRLQENHLGWPGDATAVQVIAVGFTNGESWEIEDESRKETADTKTPEVIPVRNAPFMPPTILPGQGTEQGQGQTGFVPAERPRVAPRVSPAQRSVVAPVPIPSSRNADLIQQRRSRVPVPSTIFNPGDPPPSNDSSEPR
jgi:hypothetical protein